MKEDLIKHLEMLQQTIPQILNLLNTNIIADSPDNEAVLIELLVDTRNLNYKIGYHLYKDNEH